MGHMYCHKKLRIKKDRTHLRVCEFGAIHVWLTKLTNLCGRKPHALINDPYKYLGILLVLGIPMHIIWVTSSMW